MTLHRRGVNTAIPTRRKPVPAAAVTVLVAVAVPLTETVLLPWLVT